MDIGQKNINSQGKQERENPSNRRRTESFISYSVHVCYIFSSPPETFTVDASLTLHNSGSADWPPHNPVLNFFSPHPYIVSHVLFAFCLQKVYHTRTPFSFCSHSLGFLFIWHNVEYFVSSMIYYTTAVTVCLSSAVIQEIPALDRLKAISALYLMWGQLCEMIPTVIDYRGGQSLKNPQNFCNYKTSIPLCGTFLIFIPIPHRLVLLKCSH